MDFYDRIKDLVKTNTSQTLKVFVESLDMNYDTYNGQRRYGNMLRADEAVKIAAALGTSVEYLVTGKEPNISKEALDVIKTIKSLVSNF